MLAEEKKQNLQPAHLVLALSVFHPHFYWFRDTLSRLKSPSLLVFNEEQGFASADSSGVDRSNHFIEAGLPRARLDHYKPVFFVRQHLKFIARTQSVGRMGLSSKCVAPGHRPGPAVKSATHHQHQP